MPDAIIAGVNKAGTTALFNALARHDHIHPASVKETHFFDPLKYGGQPGELSEYAVFFDNHKGAGVALEATPGYFYGGEPLATYVGNALPSVKIVVILREPGARAYSWWRFCRSRLLIGKNIGFPEYLERCSTLGQAPESSSEMVGWRGLSGGNYSRYLPAWQRVFGPSLQVVYFDDLKNDPSDLLSRVCAHLGVASMTESPPARDNVTTDIANPSLQRLALRVNTLGERFWRSSPGLKAALRRGYYSLNASGSQERLSPVDRAWLDDYYRDELRQLRNQLTHATLPSWLKGTM